LLGFTGMRGYSVHNWALDFGRLIMASKAQLTGMRGVYLVAAELSRRGYIVSPTSRSAHGADLLVTDLACEHVYAIQVKTNASTFNFWLLNSKAKCLTSSSLVYTLVNLRKDRVDYYVVPSGVVAKHVVVSKPSSTRKSTWYSVYLRDIEQYKENWDIFGR
jgi:hypothetical protein